MVLHETISAVVDMAIDALIQRNIRKEFQDSTLIVITHRLSTIIDLDNILIRNDEVRKEFDAPKKLLGRNGGVFKGMEEQRGEKQRL